MILYEDFAKLDLRIGQISTAQAVAGSNKLLKLEVNIGDVSIQILSGISQYYSPEEIIGKQVVIITNLEPRLIMGIESQGMLLAVDSDLQGSRPVLLIPDQEVAPGSRVH